MKPPQKVVLVFMGLLCPYIAVALYASQHLHNGQFPMNILRGMLIYLLCAIVLFMYLRKKILAAGLPSPPAERKAQLLRGARSLKFLGWIFLLNDIYQATKWDYSHESVGITVATFSWGVFLVFVCFWYARKMSRQAEAIAADSDPTVAIPSPLS